MLSTSPLETIVGGWYVGIVGSGGGGRSESDRGGFKKELSFGSLLAMSLGTVIGSGWLLLPGIVASKAGPAGILSWLLSGLAVLVVAMVYAELGAAWPAPGAVARYPYLSHGNFTGHIAGWAASVSYAIVPPIEAEVVTRYAGAFLPALVTPDNHLSSLGLLVTILTLAAMGLLNFYGVRYLAAFENWVTIVKYVPIVVFLVTVGLLAFPTENFWAHGGFAPQGTYGIFLGTAGTLFAYWLRSSKRDPLSGLTG